MQSTCHVPDCGRTAIAKAMCSPHYNRLRRYGDLQLRPRSSVCKKCRKDFELPTRGARPDCCKPCQRATHAAQMLADRRRKTLQYTYGLTLAGFERMNTDQGGRCAICRQKPSGGRSPHLVVDHNHDTGRIRGLLCTQCNTALGLLAEDISRIQAAIDYLETHNA